MIDMQILEEYIDGELPQELMRQVEDQLKADPSLAKQLENIRQQRTSRSKVWESYIPTEQQSAKLAAECVARLKERQYAPLEFLSPNRASHGRFQRAAMAAACVLIGAGGYMAGRITQPSPAGATSALAAKSTQYVVRIELSGGESVSQTFTDYAAAQKFARSYVVDHESTGSGQMQQVAVLQPRGVF